MMENCDFEYCKKLPEKVYPTPVYETIMAFVIGGFLWFMRKRVSAPGLLFFLYLVLNGVERYFIETIRVNDRYKLIGNYDPSQAQIIAICLFLIGVIGSVIVYQRHKKQSA